MTPRFSIVIPTMGRPDLLECLLDSLARTATRDYEVCVGWDTSLYPMSVAAGLSVGWASRLQRGVKTVKTHASKTPGMSAAVNTAFARATGDWIVWVCDDMVFLPGWDDFSFGLREDRALSFSLIEPYPSPHFPPACYAGLGPETFDAGLATEEASRRWEEVWLQGISARPTQPGHFFGSAVIHRSKFVPWIQANDPYSTNDISWFWSLHQAHPDLAFGWMPGNSLYHYVHGSVKPAGITAPEDAGEIFRKRYGLTVQEAYDRIDAHSVRLWEAT